VAQRIERFEVLAAAGVPFATPTGFVLNFPDAIVTAIAVRIPRGHARLTGIQIFYGGVQIVPKTVGVFLRGSPLYRRYEVDDLPTGTAWSGVYANTDTIAHRFQIDFELDELLGGAELYPELLLLPYQL